MTTEQTKQYYIVSIKHTSKGDAALLFWGKNGNGYSYHRNNVGLYSEEEANKSQSADNIKVEKEKVDKFWMNALDYNDEYISVPNNPTD